MDSIHVRPESLRSSEQPGCFVAAMPQAQKSTACDFGGEGECRRVGCTLPAKTAQRASTVEQVLGLVGARKLAMHATCTNTNTVSVSKWPVLY